MPQILSFKLQNFKGAASVAIDIAEKIDIPILTLVGLNESGKTTVLEGLSHFVSGDNAVAEMLDKRLTTPELTSLIPIHKKAAFTGNIQVRAVISLTAPEIQEVADKLLASHSLFLDNAKFPTQFTVYNDYEFQDSILRSSMNRWSIDLYIKPSKSSKKSEKYVRPTDAKQDGWLTAIRHIQDQLPRISYFPTFLVDMPGRIFVEAHEGETSINKYYRLVLQDVLDSLDEGISLEKHVVDRIKSYKKEQKTPSWITTFFGTPVKGHIDSVFQKISNKINREIMGSWSRIFHRPTKAKGISVEWGIAPNSKGVESAYVTFFVSDGESRYAINERSLGFRWFFSFLLFTRFKQSTARKTIFLFDEPAANLHAKAQAELLTSFSKISEGGNRVIYSTHSHHMINPRWLSGANIVENRAIDYDQADDADSLYTRPTEISVTNYRTFAANYPNRVSYFQPILEKLEYVAPEIVGDGPYVVLEGISDYYSLKYVALGRDEKFIPYLLPGGGAGAAGPLISMMLGRGHRFFILLDDDKAGKLHAGKYRKEYYLSDNIVKTLGELDATLNGMALERLMCDETLKLIQKAVGTGAPPTKKEIGLFWAEACAVGYEPGKMGKVTEERLNLILDRVLVALEKI